MWHSSECDIFHKWLTECLEKREGERVDLIGVCYQLLLHRWDVFSTSIDQSGVILAE